MSEATGTDSLQGISFLAFASHQLAGLCAPFLRAALMHRGHSHAQVRRESSTTSQCCIASRPGSERPQRRDQPASPRTRTKARCCQTNASERGSARRLAHRNENLKTWQAAAASAPHEHRHASPPSAQLELRVKTALPVLPAGSEDSSKKKEQKIRVFKST